MLELRPNCERCDADLPERSLGARICSFECTFCAACSDEISGVCPNCNGELLARPVRGAATDGSHAGAVLQRYATSWLAGDLDALVACYHPDFTLHYGGDHRFAGSHRGLEAALAVLAEVSSVAPRTLVSIDEVLAGDTGGALVVTERLERDGVSHELVRVLRYRVADGLLAECWLLDADQSLVDRLWR